MLGGQEVQASDLGVALASGPGTQAGHPGSSSEVQTVIRITIANLK